MITPRIERWLVVNMLKCFLVGILCFGLLFCPGCETPGSIPELMRGAGTSESPERLHRGTLAALKANDISSHLFSPIQFLIEEGRRVKKGELLARLSTLDRENKLKDFQAREVSARVAVKKSQLSEEAGRKSSSIKARKAQLELTKKKEEFQKADEGRDWSKIFQTRQDLRVFDLETKVTQKKIEAGNALIQRGFGTQVEQIRLEFSRELLNLEASFTQKLLPWMEKTAREKDRYLALLSLERASESLELVLMDGEISEKVNQFDLESKRSDLETIIGEIRRCREEIASAEVRAEVDGIVQYQQTFNGTSFEKVSEGDRAFPGYPFLTLLDVKRLAVEFLANQQDIGTMTASWSLTFQPDAAPEFLLTGTISEVAILALESEMWDPQGERTVKVKAILDQSPTAMRLGFSGTVRVFPPGSLPGQIPPGKVLLKSARIWKGPLKRSLTVSGEVRARRRSLIDSSFSGRVSWLAEDGATVKAEDVLARMDVADLEKEIGDLEIQIRTKEEQLALLREKNHAEGERWQQQVEMGQRQKSLAELEQKMLLERRDEDQVIILEKNLELNKAKIGLLNETQKMQKELVKRGLKSENDLLETTLLLAREQRDLAVNQDKLDREKDGPSRRQVRIGELNIAIAEADLETVSQSGEQTRQQAALEEAGLDAEIGRLRVDLEEKLRKKSSAEIRSPRGGMVILPESWRGGQMARVKAGDQVSGKIPFMQVADMTSLEVKLEVSEMDIKFLTPGLPVTLMLKSAPGKTFPGWVREVGSMVEGRKGRQDSIADVVICLTKNGDADTLVDDAFRPGGSCEAAITLYDVSDALQVPFDAIVPGASGPSVLDERGILQPLSLLFSDGLRGMVASEGVADGQAVSCREEIP